MTLDQKQQAIEQHSSQANQFAERYEHFADSPYQSCFAYSRQRLHSLLRRFLPQEAGLQVLDVGCGTGHHLAELHRQGYKTAGIDGSAEMLAHARQLNPDAELHQGDVETLPFPTASFDVVLCIEVFRYLPNITRCLSELSRVLKPGGMCLATATPLFNLNGYWFLNRVVEELPLGNFVRLRQFFTTKSQLQREFSRLGFSSVTVHGVYWGPINWVERLCPSFLSPFLQKWEFIDTALADRPAFREFANMFLVKAIRS